MYEPSDPESAETSSGDPALEIPNNASASPTPATKRSSHLHVSKTVAALALVLVVLFSSLAGFGGGLLATGLFATATPTVTVTASATSGATPTTTSVITTPYPTSSAGSVSTTGLTFAEIAARDVPSVVQINVTETVTVRGRTYTASGAGAGIVLTSDGYIVTCNHVVTGATSVSVVLADGKTLDATVVATDATNDVAVLKIAATGLTVAVVGSSGDLVVGDTAVAIGNPLELGNTVSQGIISSLSRSITMDNNTMDLLQTDAAINPGNSGGGLFNSEGQLIGIVVAKSSGSNIEGLGFAIPIDHVKAWISTTIAKG